MNLKPILLKSQFYSDRNKPTKTPPVQVSCIKLIVEIKVTGLKHNWSQD